MPIYSPWCFPEMMARSKFGIEVYHLKKLLLSFQKIINCTTRTLVTELTLVHVGTQKITGLNILLQLLLLTAIIIETGS